MKRFVVLGLALLTLTACTSLKEGSKKTFSRAHSCPIDKVESRERKDVRASDFESFGVPSLEIREDPDRRQEFYKNQDEVRRSWDRAYTVYEVAGCSDDVLYRCTSVAKSSEPFVCSEVKDPPSSIRLWSTK